MVDVDVRNRKKSIDVCQFLYEYADDEETKERLENFLTQLFRQLFLKHASFFLYLNRRITISPKEVGEFIKSLFLTMDLTVCRFAPSNFYYCERLFEKTTDHDTIRRLNAFMTELFGQLLKKQSMLFAFLKSNELKTGNDLNTFFQDIFSPLKLGVELPLPYVKLEKLNMNNFIPRVSNELGEVTAVFLLPIEQDAVANNTLPAKSSSSNKKANPIDSSISNKKHEEPIPVSGSAISLLMPRVQKVPAANVCNKFKKTSITLDCDGLSGVVKAPFPSKNVDITNIKKSSDVESDLDNNDLNVGSITAKETSKSKDNRPMSYEADKRPAFPNVKPIVEKEEEIVSTVYRDSNIFPAFKFVEKPKLQICDSRDQEKEIGQTLNSSKAFPLFRRVPNPVSSTKAKEKDSNPGNLTDDARDCRRKKPVFKIVSKSTKTKPAN